MKISLIKRIKDILKKEWGKVYYSENHIDYEPRLKYSMKTDYDIYARILWLSYKTSSKFQSDDAISLTAEYLASLEKFYLANEEKDVDMNLINIVAHKIHDECQRDRKNIPTSEDIKNVRIELKTKYSCHCCSTLTQTDNAEERFFPRMNVVYIPPLNAYVLTNNRKYVYVPDIDTYMLDQRIMYKILDFCPFCGDNLKEDRIKTEDDNKHILKYIDMWRNEGEGKVGPYKTSHKITTYGINCYDSYNFISEILATKYVNYDNSFGVDASGSLYKGAKFITVEKLFYISEKYEFYKFFDYTDLYLEEDVVQNTEIIKYFRDKLTQKKQFCKNDFEILKYILRDVFWNMFHQQECFDELLEG